MTREPLDDWDELGTADWGLDWATFRPLLIVLVCFAAAVLIGR